MEKSAIRGEDIIVSECAKEDCVAGKKVDFYAKDERRYYALHYITYGNGALTTPDGGEKILQPGDLFIIPPGKDISYRTIDRWEYFWVNVEGKQAWTLLKHLGFDNDTLIVSYKRDVDVVSAFTDLIECCYKTGDVDLKGKGYFYLLLGSIYNGMHARAAGRDHHSSAFYVKEAQTYLKYNFYYAGVGLDSLARNLAINKNYLCTIFKRETGRSPIQYLIELRMEAAGKRLLTTDESIADVARYVGYKDPLYFSKEFRKYYGVSPTQYRRDGV